MNHRLFWNGNAPFYTSNSTGPKLIEELAHKNNSTGLSFHQAIDHIKKNTQTLNRTDGHGISSTSDVTVTLAGLDLQRLVREKWMRHVTVRLTFTCARLHICESWGAWHFCNVQWPDPKIILLILIAFLIRFELFFTKLWKTKNKCHDFFLLFQCDLNLLKNICNKIGQTSVKWLGTFNTALF